MVVSLASCVNVVKGSCVCCVNVEATAVVSRLVVAAKVKVVVVDTDEDEDEDVDVVAVVVVVVEVAVVNVVVCVVVLVVDPAVVSFPLVFPPTGPVTMRAQKLTALRRMNVHTNLPLCV